MTVEAYFAQLFRDRSCIVKKYMLSDFSENDRRVEYHWRWLRWVDIGHVYEGTYSRHLYRFYPGSILPVLADLAKVNRKLLLDHTPHEFLRIEHVRKLFPECCNPDSPMPDYVLTDYIRERAGFI